MQALHATGRTAEALEQYADYRRSLADDLGIEPSPALREVQVALLNAAVDSVPATLGRARPDAAAVRHGLPGLQVRYLRSGAGNVIAFGTVGNGPPVVVLLGWISSLDVVASGRDPRSSLLERLTGELSLTLFDRAGTGLSPGPVADYGLDASVDELRRDVVRAVGPPVSLLADVVVRPDRADPRPPASGVGRVPGLLRHLRERPGDLRRRPDARRWSSRSSAPTGVSAPRCSPTSTGPG